MEELIVNSAIGCCLKDDGPCSGAGATKDNLIRISAKLISVVSITRLSAKEEGLGVGYAPNESQCTCFM